MPLGIQRLWCYPTSVASRAPDLNDMLKGVRVKFVRGQRRWAMMKEIVLVVNSNTGQKSLYFPQVSDCRWPPARPCFFFRLIHTAPPFEVRREAQRNFESLPRIQ